MPVPENLKTWQKCVKATLPVHAYGFIKGKDLKKVQKCYCASG